jgi:steroid delta-isomerase-like uncharacterized protein
MSANRKQKTQAETVVADLHELVWSRGDYESVEAFVAPSYTVHSDPGDPWEGRSLDHTTYRARVQYSRDAFPDLEFAIQDIVSIDDRVAVRWTATGTHLGALPEIPATGKRLTFSGQTFYEMQDGRAAGHWQVVDRLGFVQQLRRALSSVGAGAEPPRATAYLDVTEEAGRAFVRRQLTGNVVMLNLLRFRAQADYSAAPHLAPSSPIDGRAAYRRYVEHTLPLLRRSGGDIVYFGVGGPFLVGPRDERWDAAMLVRQRSAADFVAWASDPEFQTGAGHRAAALEDSRLLPLVDAELP